MQLPGIAEKLAVLPRLEARLDTVSIQLADVRVSGAEQFGEVRSDLDNLRGEVARMPSTWQMLVASLIAAVVFGVAHLLGRV